MYRQLAAAYHFLNKCGRQGTKAGGRSPICLANYCVYRTLPVPYGRRGPTTCAQLLEDAERLIAAWIERQAKRMPMLFSPTIGAAITARLLVPAGAVPSLPHHRRCRPAEARLAPRGGGHGPYPGAVMPVLPAERTVCRTRLPFQVERCRGVLRGA
jgi:hypothetical protein